MCKDKDKLQIVYMFLLQKVVYEVTIMAQLVISIRHSKYFEEKKPVFKTSLSNFSLLHKIYHTVSLNQCSFTVPNSLNYCLNN